MTSEQFKKNVLPKLNPVDVYKEVLSGKNIHSFPKGFWADDLYNHHIVPIMKWLIEDKLQLSDDEILRISTKFMRDHKLYSVMNKKSIFEIINATYPGRFKPWEFKSAPKGFWCKIENVLAATRWLIEEKLKLTHNELCTIKSKIFRYNKLCGVENFVCLNNISFYDIINILYPNKFKPWEMSATPRNFWDKKSNRIAAIKWLFEEKLHCTEDELLHTSVPYELYARYGLSGLFSLKYHSVHSNVMKEVYPELINRLK